MNELGKNGQDSIVLYQSPDGQGGIEVRVSGDTIWLSLNQIAELFRIDKSGVSRHIRNIFRTGELTSEATVAKNATVQSEGGRTVTRSVEYYNLDMVISVGYRVNSSEATAFRIWATKTLRDYLVKGYVLNQRRLHEQGWHDVERAIGLMRTALPSQLHADEVKGLLDIIKTYARTWYLLKEYDDSTLRVPKLERQEEWAIRYNGATQAIRELKDDLRERGEASDLFGLEREEMLQGILGSLYQTYGGAEVYLSVEEKAAHLLYFIIKDHPFVDGNKRIGTYMFIVYLDQNRLLLEPSGVPKFTDSALVALALLVAESRPEQKEEMLTLIVHFVRNA